MKSYLLAVAVAALSASVVMAEDKPATSTPPTTSAPVVVGSTGTTYVEYVPVQSTRRGLFARLRNRTNRMTYTTVPMMVTAPSSPAPMPTPAPQPMPMPGTKTDNTVSTPKTTTVVPATGNLPPGIYTTTDGTVIQIGGTTTGSVMTAGYMETTPARRGFFSRLRNR